MKSSIYFFAVATVLSVTLSNCKPTKTINCPPQFTIYKNINKAYPVYAKDFLLELKNSLTTAKKLEDTASATIKSNVVKLREDLNNISSRVETLTKSNLLSYFGGICDENVRKRFSDFQNKLADLTLQLTQIEAKIGPSKSLSDDTNKKVNEALTIANNMSQSIQ